MQWLTLVSSPQEGRGLDPQPKGLAEWSLHELSRCFSTILPQSKKKKRACVVIWNLKLSVGVNAGVKCLNYLSV